VRKCVGNPLTIRVVGALMRGIDKDEDWEAMTRKDLCRIKKTDQDVIIQLIKLSYDHLPYLFKR
jgi:hypothetical protein